MIETEYLFLKYYEKRKDSFSYLGKLKKFKIAENEDGSQ